MTGRREAGDDPSVDMNRDRSATVEVGVAVDVVEDVDGEVDEKDAVEEPTIRNSLID